MIEPQPAIKRLSFSVITHVLRPTKRTKKGDMVEGGQRKKTAIFEYIGKNYGG